MDRPSPKWAYDLDLKILGEEYDESRTGETDATLAWSNDEI